MAWFSWQQAKQLDPSLNAVAEFFVPAPAQVQTVTGGLTNRCWKILDANGKAYVWRPASKVCQAFSISRYSEYQILAAIAPLKIGPKPILVNEQGLLVEWLEGVTMRGAASIDTLLKTCIKIHEFDAHGLPLAPFGYTARVDHYWMQLDGHYLGSEFENLYQQWRMSPPIEPLPAVLCHFDLGDYNLVKGPDGVKVIDWEYAALADPRLELALVIQVAEENVFESVCRYCQLREIDDIDLWLDGVKAWQPRLTMMAMLWYLLADKLWGGEEYLLSAKQMLHTLCHEDHCLQPQPGLPL
ncbi:thiamine kinase [Vibrio cidicii]|uniref:Thiamine kinase n=1 Tax=Vibrio cidicii TaxID=1763883 RepID=A0A151JKA4_9VIBR|nr:thiamine kinase [Vibrio cidicii]ELV8623973.1 thiamine kinase [Vibrio cidicii]KYN26195.1 thiamine kinase [Vibrio cidicii]KYN83868.1 thiamine kinase [Vibrio cidicii]KYN89823.1 thiamine kinase [Vibrio cidicii]